MKASCGKCKAWWTGAQRSHCARCHLTFSSISAFDKHWGGRKGFEGCKHPDECGLIPFEKDFGFMYGHEFKRWEFATDDD